MKAVLLALSVFLCISPLPGQQKKPVYSEQEKPIVEKIRSLRAMPDDERARATRQLALDIRALPPSENKVPLAEWLANRSTEGDSGRETLQEVAMTLAGALRAQPVSPAKDGPASPYSTLAQLVRYEHVRASLDEPQFKAAMAALEKIDQDRRRAGFTLADLQGKQWTLKGLRGKVVLVNFWATWCQPCRKEMPDLDTLYTRFKDQGLVVLAVSADETEKVKPFIEQGRFTFPVLLDTGGKVSEMLHVEGIPKTFIYDRSGNLVAQANDMRTQKQFLALLAEAGLK